ncbi:MAG: insulinase family protein [candidate division Zixibacteria bacterium]|nr:insulinase family protein [candidate division Zixibacteria bacterium]
MRLTRIMLCAILLSGSSIAAQTGEFQLDVKKQVLANGMRILVLENHSAPVFSTIIRFNTGSVDEQPGITGTSHLLEHMLFKGTKILGTSNYEAEVPLMRSIDSLAALHRAEQIKLSNPLNPRDSTRLNELKKQIADVQARQKQYVIKDELWGAYLENGGTGLNASTSNDGTQYYVSLPKSCLELWMFLEADRLENLVLREFYSERDVVMEERRLRTENSPFGKLDEALSAAMFWASGYHWPVVGWMSDLMTVSREQVEAYFRSHYSPANATAVVVGDVNADEVFALAERYFAKIPSLPAPPPVVSRDAEQSGERRVEVEMDANPIAFIAYNMPAIGHPDCVALEAAASILSSGRTSRFHKAIREKKLGSAQASASASRLPSAFTVTLTPFGNTTIPQLEEAVYAEIERLATEPVTQWELEKMRNQVDASLIRSLESNNGLAFRIANSESVTGNWRYFLDSREALKKVTADDIMRVAKRYLVKRNRTVAFITKTPASQPATSSKQS